MFTTWVFSHQSLGGALKVVLCHSHTYMHARIQKMFSSSAVYMYVHHMSAWAIQKRVLRSLEPEFKMDVNYYVGVSAQVLRYS